MNGRSVYASLILPFFFGFCRALCFMSNSTDNTMIKFPRSGRRFSPSPADNCHVGDATLHARRQMSPPILVTVAVGHDLVGSLQPLLTTYLKSIETMAPDLT